MSKLLICVLFYDYNLGYYTNQVFCVGLCISCSTRRPGATGSAPGDQVNYSAHLASERTR